MDNIVTDTVGEIRDTADLAIDVAKTQVLYGGIAGVVAGAAVGKFLESRLTFSGRLTNTAGALVEFLAGAGLYGWGITGRVKQPALRSATQVTGIVVAGMGLGRLLAGLGAPTFGLGAEDIMGLPAPDDGRVVGQDYDGREVGQAAEDEEGPFNKPDNMRPMRGARHLNTAGLPWAIAEGWDIMAPSAGPSGNGVEQWYGSAEAYMTSPQNAFIGNMVSSAEGLGSVIGQ